MAFTGGKEDLNTLSTSTEFDVLPGGLAERQARAFRPDPNYHRGTALAVVSGDGAAVGAGIEVLLSEMLMELRAIRVGIEIMTDQDIMSELT